MKTEYLADNRKLHIYLVRFYDLKNKPILLKIGVTLNTPEYRLRNQIPLKFDVVLFRKTQKSRKLELEIIRKFLKFSTGRGRMREWFTYSETLEKRILKIIKPKTRNK